MADELTPQEQAYFDAGGEAPVEAAETPEAPVEAPQAEASVEPSEAPAEPPKKDGSWVPIGALHETRAQLKETKAAIEAMHRQRAEDEARWAVAQERLNMMQQAMMRANQPPEPTFDDDPVAASRRGLEQAGAAVQQLGQEVLNIKQQQEMRAAIEDAQRWAIASEQRYAREKQDFPQAVEYLVKSRMDELQEAKYAPQQILHIMQQERMALLQRAREAGSDWANTLYGLARARGYQGKASVPAEQKMQQLQEGTKAAAGLSEVSGRQTVPLSIQSLAAMDEDDFYKISSNPKEWAKLMGG